MKRKHLLGYAIIIVMGISFVATMYPAQMFLGALALLPVVFVWCVATTPSKKRD